MSAHDDRLTRREVLKKAARTAGAAAFPILGQAAPPKGIPRASSAALAGAAPAYAPKFFSADQMRTLAALAETIIPADDHSPGARAARVEEFMDTILAESPANRQSQWTEGIAALNRLAQQQFQKPFEECSVDQQAELMRQLSANEDHPSTPEDHFFIALKNATIEGYYTSSIGIHQELEYQGNMALGEFPGCEHMPHKTENK